MVGRGRAYDDQVDLARVEDVKDDHLAVAVREDRQRSQNRFRLVQQIAEQD